MKNYNLIALVDINTGKTLLYTYKHIKGTRPITKWQRKYLTTLCKHLNDNIKYERA